MIISKTQPDIAAIDAKIWSIATERYGEPKLLKRGIEWDEVASLEDFETASASEPVDAEEASRFCAVFTGFPECSAEAFVVAYLKDGEIERFGCGDTETENRVAERFFDRDAALSPRERKRTFLPDVIAANDNKPQASKPTSGISLLSFSEFKAQDSGGSDAMIKGLIRTGTLIAIGGRPGAGKTALMLAMAEALDAGEPFLGRDTVPTTVVVIAAEDGGDIANRLEAMGNERIKIARLPDGFQLDKPGKAADVLQEIIHQARAIDRSRRVMVVVDTLRAALGGVSVLEDRTTSPALNALRKVAELEGAVVAVLNHTNRENNKATKGETLEAVAALELVLLEGEGDWFNIYVGKNRSGQGHRNIGRVKYTSAEVGGVTAAVVDELVADESPADAPKERGPSGNATILQGIILTAILESEDRRRPFGTEGPLVKTVPVPLVRSRFYERREGTPDTKKKAFGRALTQLINMQWVVRGGGDEEGHLWLARASDEEAPIKGDGTYP